MRAPSPSADSCQLGLLSSWLDSFASGSIGEPGMQDRRTVQALAAEAAVVAATAAATGRREQGLRSLPCPSQNGVPVYQVSPFASGTFGTRPKWPVLPQNLPRHKCLSVFMRDAPALGLALRCTRNAFGSPSSQSWASWPLIEAWACMNECRHRGMPPALGSHRCAPQAFAISCAPRCMAPHRHSGRGAPLSSCVPILDSAHAHRFPQHTFVFRSERQTQKP